MFLEERNGKKKGGMLIVRPFLLYVLKGIFQNKICKFFQLSKLVVFSQYLKTAKSERVIFL